MKNEKLKAAVETAAEDTKKVLEELEKAAEPSVEKAKAAVKSAAKKAEPTVKAAVDSAKEAGKTAVETARVTGKKVAAALDTELYVQYCGAQYDCDDITARCKADYKKDHKDAIRACSIYIKPEDGAAYYVINGTQGKLAL